MLAYFEAKIIHAQKDLKMQILKIQEGHIKIDRNVTCAKRDVFIENYFFKEASKGHSSSNVQSP